MLTRHFTLGTHPHRNPAYRAGLGALLLYVRDPHGGWHRRVIVRVRACRGYADRNHLRTCQQFAA